MMNYKRDICEKKTGIGRKIERNKKTWQNLNRQRGSKLLINRRKYKMSLRIYDNHKQLVQNSKKDFLILQTLKIPDVNVHISPLISHLSAISF